MALSGCQKSEHRDATAQSAEPAPLTPPLALNERRLLAQRLAQQGGANAGATLEQLLRDEDPITLNWAAFGLGQECRGHELTRVSALVTRAASLTQQATSGDPLARARAFTLALSRCASKEAERTLLAWLGRPPPMDQQAALGLARLAERQRTLEDGSLVGLLDAAGNPQRANGAALLAIDRLAGVSPSAATRISDVARAALKASGEHRAPAISALVHGDERADELLALVVGSADYALHERALAVRALARRPANGLVTLARTFVQLSNEHAKAKDASAAPWPVVLAILRSFPSDYPHIAESSLRRWAALAIPNEAPRPLRHRLVQARCLAAALLADDSRDRRLLTCDDTGGISGALAQIDVLDRRTIAGPRLAQWQSLLASSAARVRQAALRMLAGHRELPAPAVLAQALADAQPGTVAAAANLLAAHPDRAMREGSAQQVDDAIVKALTAAFERQYGPDQLAVRGALAEAAAALQLLSLKSKVEQLCRSPSPSLRDKAKRALGMFGEREASCPAPQAASSEVAAEGELRSPVTLVFVTSAGEHTLQLHPERAPRSVRRILDLVGAGFYDNMVIHRAVPGQVVQFGDPIGDGYGGCGREPIASELSSQHFAAFNVGMADFGKDTASSQLFVTLSAAPGLDGEYTWVGKASLSWERVVLDDVIERAYVR